jgi:hypothetical protein
MEKPAAYTSNLPSPPTLMTRGSRIFQNSGTKVTPYHIPQGSYLVTPAVRTFYLSYHKYDFSFQFHAHRQEIML